MEAPVAFAQTVAPVAVTPIVTAFLGSVDRRFSVPAAFHVGAARSLGQDWPQAIGGADAERS